MRKNDYDGLISLLNSLKKKLENEGVVRTRPLLKNVNEEHASSYMLSMMIHYCYACNVSKDLALEICKSSIFEGKINLEPQNGIYDYAKLQSRSFTILKEYLENLLKQESVPDHLPVTYTSTLPFYRVDQYSLINKRHKQEDRYFSVTNIASYSMKSTTRSISSQPCLALGVFDGHNGPEAAEHAHHLAPFLLAEWLNSGATVPHALGEVFISLNQSIHSCRSKFKWHSGCTATICVLNRGIIYTAWVGDTQAWLFYKNGDCLALTDVLHRPDDPEEYVTITDLGGDVSDTPGEERVGGVLAVSRALGDDQAITGISSLPSNTAYRLRGDELCLVVASDGLWDSDKCSGEDLATIISHQMEKTSNEDDLSNLPRLLTERAIQNGSTDNTTVVVVAFNPDCAKAMRARDVINECQEIDIADYRLIQYPYNRRRSLAAFDDDETEDKVERRASLALFDQSEKRFSSPTRVKTGPCGLQKYSQNK